jgi:lipoprotein-releasing system permease protein
MGYSLFIAKKYIGAGRRSAFITAITTISVAGVAIGVLALITVIAVLNGFENEVIERIIGTNAHVIIRRADGFEDYQEVAARLKDMHAVEGIAPFIFTKAMVISRDATDGLLIRGIDLEKESEVTEISSYVKPAHFSFDSGDSTIGKIVIGREAAFMLRVALGDTIVLAGGDLSASFPLSVMPIFHEFEVGGFFDSGMYEYDASYGFISLEDAQDFADLGTGVTGLSVKLQDMDDAPMVAQAMMVMLGPGYMVSDWIRLNRNLFTWMKMEKKVMFIILSLIIVVAAFGIASTLIMVVMQRVRDIGILRSLGATSGAVMHIFMLHGLIIGVLGTAIGTAGGITLAQIVNRFKLIELPGEVYFVDTVPVMLRLWDILAIDAIALLVCFAATLYPAWKASRLIPVEAIRYE